MPTINGVSTIGRVVLASGITANGNAALRINRVGGIPRLQRVCWFEHVRVVAGREYAGVGWGLNVWFDGAELSYQGVSAGQSRSLVATWVVDGIPWELTY